MKISIMIKFYSLHRSFSEIDITFLQEFIFFLFHFTLSQLLQNKKIQILIIL